MSLFGRIFKKAEKNQQQVQPKEEMIPNGPVQHNYGLDMLGFLLDSRDYGWSEPDTNHKKVILTNPQDCKDKITLMGLISAWNGTGHFEWEAVLSGWFIKSVLTAIENGENEADITNMFNRDLTASNNRVFTKEQVFAHLTKWFDIAEDDDSIRMKVHIG